MKNLSLLAIAVALSISGCAIKPEQSAITPTIPAEFRDVDVTLKRYQTQFNHWHTFYKDPAIDYLINKALSREDLNLNIAKVLEQYKQAQAAVQSAQSSFWPTMGLHAEGSKERTYLDESTVGARSNGASLIGRYELDMWGRAANSANAANYRLLAVEQNVEAVMKSIRHQVVTQYWTIRQVDAEMNLLRSQIEARKRQLAMDISRVQFGKSTELAVQQAKAKVASLERQYVALEASRKTLDETLANLLGDEQFRVAMHRTPKGTTPIELGKPLPSYILTERSDVKAAEARMKATGLDVAVARAALYPSITFSAGAGALNGSTVESSFWTLGYSIDLPLFDRGLRLSQIQQAKAQQRESVIDYQLAIKSAYHDVNKELIELERLDKSTKYLQQERTAAQQAYAMAVHQYQSGLIGYTQLLDAQQAHEDAQKEFLKMEFAKRIAEANYLRALGF